MPINLLGKFWNSYLQDVSYPWCIKEVQFNQRHKVSMLPKTGVWNYTCHLWTPLSYFFIVTISSSSFFYSFLKTDCYVSFSLNDTKTLFLFLPPLSFLPTSAGICNPFVVGVALSISHVGSWTEFTYLPLCCLSRQKSLPGIQVGRGGWGPGDYTAKSWPRLPLSFQHPTSPLCSDPQLLILTADFLVYHIPSTKLQTVLCTFPVFTVRCYPCVPHPFRPLPASSSLNDSKALLRDSASKLDRWQEFLVKQNYPHPRNHKRSMFFYSTLMEA